MATSGQGAQPACPVRPSPPPRAFDGVPWLAAATVLLMLALIVARELGELLGHPLPPRVAAVGATAVWWLYWGGVVFFAVAVVRRWRNTYFRWRTLSTVLSQTLFGILLAGPLKAALGVPYGWQRLHLTWPLHMSVITPDLYAKHPSVFFYGVVFSFVAWPIMTLFLGMRYCSWFCFCGNLAENAGDTFRTKGPKGPRAQNLDVTGYVVLLAAAMTTVALFIGVTWPYRWYDVVVGFLLADVIGIGLYPILGNRIWCRFLCPLRAVLGWFSRRGRFAIYTDGQRCIECGTCNRYCEMGIDIRMRARQGVPMRDTECVACGACIAVCPRYALSFYPFPGPEEALRAPDARRFRRPFRRQLATPRGR
ncbi:MAG: 4Fe-4S binding protein [Armatimonadota bacterium]